MAVMERTGARAREAEASLGPIGHLFASPAVARVLTVFLQNPEARLTLGQISKRAGRQPKGTVQSSLRKLEAARLVYREGSANSTAYRYAADRAMGQRMLALVQASRQEAMPDPESGIPWLEELMRTRARIPLARPHGGRKEAVPSTEATERVLAAAERAEEPGRPRARPGLRTRA